MNDVLDHTIGIKYLGMSSNILLHDFVVTLHHTIALELTRGVHRTLTPRSQTLFHHLGTIPVEWE